jgi:2-polyprenyl-3-methyl-5-hydroxy-6-metoxy-1,4-benzoquinol methylase
MDKQTDQLDSSKKMMFYENIADRFDSIVNNYDTNRRLEVIYEELLTEDITGKKLLDAGCGTGWFSAAAAKRGANVTSMDVGPELLKQVSKKCQTECVVGSILEIPFEEATFDVVVSSEVIEHVVDPKKALSELFRVLKPGGTLVLTTPNAFWHWSLSVANAFNIREYQGLENWLGYQELIDSLSNLGFNVEQHRGLHLFPFVLKPTHGLLRWLDKHHQFYDKLMVNVCVKATKPHRM